MQNFIAIAALTGLAAAASGQVQAGFWLVGLPAGQSGGSVTALSQDGSIAVGATGGTTGVGTPGFTWTREGGRFDFGLLPGMPPQTPAYGVSSDGSVVAGETTSGVYRWTGTGPVQDLGTLSGEIRMYARGVSGDGATVIGWGEHTPQQNSFGQAYRWTEAGGMQGLGYTRFNGTISEAYGISRDGSTVVGLSQSGGPGGPVDAFAWTQATGMRALPQLPGAPFEDSFARAAAADGSVIVGYGPGPSGHTHAIRWTSAGAQDLGLPAGYAGAYAYAVDDAGSVVAGVMNDANTGADNAFVWTPTSGIVLLSDYLSGFGVGVPAGYRLAQINAVSGDGLTFGGFARNLSTNTVEGFVATVPAPSSVLLLIVLAQRRRRCALA